MAKGLLGSDFDTTTLVFKLKFYTMAISLTETKSLFFWLLALSFFFTACGEEDDEDQNANPILNPSVTISTNAVDFEAIEKGFSKKRPIVITAGDLTQDISLAVTGDLFSISDAENGTFSNSLGFSAADLNAAESAVIYLKFGSTGVDASSDFEGTLSVNSEMGETTIPLTGSVVVLQPTINASATAMDFGELVFGNEAIDFFTITAADLKQDLEVSVASDAFSIAETEEGTFGSVVNIPAESINTGERKVFVKFQPSGSGIFEGTVTIASELEDKSITLTGSAVITTFIEVSPSALDFGEVNLGTSSTKSLTLTATSLTTDVLVTSASSEFTVSTDEGGTFESTLAIPAATLNAQNAMDIFVQYTPGTEGNSNSSITFTSELGDNIVTLSGTGFVNTFQWEENFDYANDLPLISRPASRADVLADHENWVDLRGGTRTLLPGLSFTNYPGSGIGKALGFEGIAANRKNYARTIKDPAAGPGEIQYVSFLFSILSAPSGGSTPVVLATWQETVNAKWNDRFIVRDDGGDIKFGIVNGGGAGAVQAMLAGKVITPGQPYVIVLKKEWIDGGVNGRTSLFILESIPPAEPVADAVSVSDNTEVPDAIVLTGNHQFEGTIDGLRLAKDWDDLFKE